MLPVFKKVQPRQEILDFAEAMEFELQKYDTPDDTSWEDASNYWLTRKLMQSQGKIADCSLKNRPIGIHCLDVAIFAMFLRHKNIQAGDEDES